MDNSIENIWKEGFSTNKNLNVPELVDFYNRKSEHVIIRIKNTMYNNHKSTILFAFILLVTNMMFGQVLIGCIILVVYTITYIYGKKQLESMEQIDFGTSSYEYLKNFDLWWNNTVSRYSRVVIYMFPLLIFITILLEIFSLSINEPVRLQQIISDPVAIYIGFGFVVLVTLSRVFSTIIYKKVLNLTYGKELNKLKNLIHDMEELRNIK